MDDPLIVAAWLGEDSNVRTLMKTKKPDVATVETAVLSAGQAGHLKVVQTLFKCKADVNSESAQRVLEIFAIQQERLETVPMFLKFGLSGQSKVAGSIFEYAADKGKKDGAKLIHMLLEHGLHAQSEAAGRGLQLASQAGHDEIVNAILEAKADPTSHDAGLALRGASLTGQTKVAHALLKAGTAAASDEGNDALRCAVRASSDTIVKMLLERGSDPSSGLPMAAFMSNAKLVKLLMEAQADASSKRKAMKEAARYGHEKILSLLLDNGAEPRSREGDTAMRITTSALRMNCESEKTLVKRAAVFEHLENHGTRRLLPQLGDLRDGKPCSKTPIPLVMSQVEIKAPRWHSPTGFGLRSRMASAPNLQR